MKLPAVLAFVIIAQVSEANGCGPKTPAPTPPAELPITDTFTTDDGLKLGVQTVLSNLQIPWSMTFAPDGRMFFTERGGRVRVYQNGELLAAPVLTLDDAYTSGEAGALGLTLDPQFAANHFAYLLYTATAQNASGRRNRLVRYREANNTFADRAVLLDDIPAADNHDGGRLRFGPDGRLYVTMGDAAVASNAQSLSSLSGKILRLNSDGSTASGNPYGSPIWTWGHRNPQGIDWNPQTGDMWEAEHGNSANDEINLLVSGRNYGWPTIEASATRPDMETPKAFFASTVAPSGLSFYTGTRMPGLVRNFFVATLRGVHIHRVVLDAADPTRIARTERWLENKFGRIRDVVTGPDGALYFCTSNRDGRGSLVAADDRIARIVPVQ